MEALPLLVLVHVTDTDTVLGASASASISCFETICRTAKCCCNKSDCTSEYSGISLETIRMPFGGLRILKKAQN